MKSNKTKNQILVQLKEVPIVQIACSKAGVSRATYYRWRDEDAEFRKSADEAIAEGVLFINDMSESQMISLIKDKNWPAISFWLKHRHASYANKLELSGRVTTLDEELTPEQKALVDRALRLASLVEEEDKNQTHGE